MITFQEHFENLASGTEDRADPAEEPLVIDTDQILNQPFTNQEIFKAIKHLKNNKAAGHDQIINEFMKSSPDKVIPIYTRLFNVVLCSGKVPDAWCVSSIRPIYKK